MIVFLLTWAALFLLGIGAFVGALVLAYVCVVAIVGMCERVMGGVD